MRKATINSNPSQFHRTSISAAIALVLAQLTASQFALAQTQPAAEAVKVEKIEVTGSSIKRIEGESALPVQVLKKEDIEKTGATTAAELLRTIAGNSNQLTDGASITDGTSGQRGFNGANLRGVGVSSTLILLNGRRMANFASPGDNSGVDLNNIPAGAIQRVEVLKDGASAIYGTDAIGGVINFITRRDFQGAEGTVYFADTQHGGASKKTASISAGFGDINKDRFNVFGVLDYQDLGSLRSSQRQFITDYDIPNTLPHLLSSRTFPANVRFTSSQARATGTPRTWNPSAPACSPPATVYAPTGVGGTGGCTYNYMQDTEIYPDSNRLGIMGRAVFAINADNRIFAELLQSKTETKYVLSPNPIAVTGVPASFIPGNISTRLAPNATVEVRLRMTEAGNRSNEVESTASRFVLGVEGQAAGWDYTAAYNRAENKVTDNYVNGYVLFSPFVAAVRAGTVNPFAPSKQPGIDLINSIKVNDAARKSEGTTQTIDLKGSRTLANLAGGELALAVGVEHRKEDTRFNPSSLLISNEIAGDRDGSGTLPKLAATSSSRKVSALFAELNAPFTKQLEAQFALRHDRYSGIGNTTNPKFGLRYVPTKEVLVRGSIGTGFRAPSNSDLNRPTVFGSTASVLPDPVLCRAGGNLADCSDQWPVERRSNPNLKPEKSQQFSIGAVFEPVRDLSFSADYWNITKKDVIKDIGEETVLADPVKYSNLITRDADGFITNIVLQKQNQGRLRTSGVDLALDWRSPKSDYGRVSVGLTGTYVLKYEEQPAPGEAYYSSVGRFVNDKVIQRWRHRVSLGWDRGPVGLTLANTFYQGYTDQNSAIDLNTGNKVQNNKVGAYSVIDLTGSYDINKQLRLRAGLLNLADKKPPFSNQAYFFLAGYDPTYTDPRGRTYYVSLNFRFK